MSKTIDQALKEAGFKVKLGRNNKRWPKKIGKGTMTITMATDRAFEPGTGFAVSFVATRQKS